MFEDEYAKQATKRAVPMSYSDATYGISGSRAIPKTLGGPERDLGGVAIALKGFEEQLAYSEQAVSSLEDRLNVLRRPVPAGVEGGEVNRLEQARSSLANGISEYVARLAHVNARLFALEQSLDL